MIALSEVLFRNAFVEDPQFPVRPGKTAFWCTDYKHLSYLGLEIMVAQFMKHVIENKKESSASAIKVKWIDGVRFVASDDRGHSVVMDVSREQGGEGSAFSPMQLLLAALGGCTGIDIVGIMRKQRQELTSLEILVSGERVAEYPRVYSKVHVEYRLKGEGLKEKAVQRAIELSEDTYCSVGATIKKTAQISHSYSLQ